MQADRTAEGLRDLGVEVVLGHEPELRRGGFDLVHVMDGDALDIRTIRQARLPVVVSTIYWSTSYRVGPGPDADRRSRAGYSLRTGVSTFRRGAAATADAVMQAVTAQRLAFESADLLLPNSASEGDAVASELGVTTPFYVVPNAVDDRVFQPPQRDSARSGVLYVGRLEPHKNQLGLIRALAGTGIPLTIAGPVHPHHADYDRACRTAAGDDVTFAGVRTLPELVDLYGRAQVHAMPSWFETTGLSSLEAAACGAAVVTTARGYARDYFGDLAHYCDPADSESIRRAVEAATSVGPSVALRQRVLSEFTWKKTAVATKAAYERVLP